MVDARTFSNTGSSFYSLQTTLFLLELSGKNHEMKNVLDVANHRIFKYFKGKQVLNEYLHIHKFDEFILSSSIDISIDKKANRDAFFKALGMLKLCYGEEVALKFLKERVFGGKNGTLELSIAKL